MLRGFLRWFAGSKGRGSGFTLMSAGNLVAAVFTYVRQAEIARVFGTTWKTDAFAVSLVFPVLVREIVSHSIGATFIPIYSSLKENKGPEAARNLVNRLLTWAGLAGLVLSTILVVLSRDLVFLSGPGLEARSLDLASGMLRLMVPILVLSTLSGVLQGLCNLEKRYGLTSILRVAEITVSLAVVLTLSGPVGIMVLPLSVLAGAVGMFVVLVVISWRLHHSFRIELNPVDPDFAGQIRMALPVLAGSMFAMLGPVADRILASFLRESSVTALDYAGKIIKILFSVLLIPISVLANVSLSALSAGKKMVAFRKELRVLLNWNSTMMIPGSAMLMVLSVPLVSLLFQRGEFTAGDSSMVGYALLFYAPWLATFSFSSILNKAFFALKDSRTPVLVGIWGMIVNVLLNIILIAPMGIGGLALATSSTSLAKVVLLLHLLARRTEGFQGRSILLEHLKVLSSAVLMAGIVLLLRGLFPFDQQGSLSGKVLRLVLYITPAAAAYFLAMKVSGSEVLRSTIRKLGSGRS